MTGPERLLASLRGDVVSPPPAAPIYLQLYLEPRRRKLLAEVYAEMAEGEDCLRLNFEEEIEARLEALDRSAAVFSCPPAWLPVILGPSRHSVHGCKVVLGSGKCNWYGPGGGAPVDLLAPFDNRHGDVWEREGEPPDIEQLACAPPTYTAESLADAGCLEYTIRALRRFSGRFLPYASLGAPFWLCY